MTGISPTVMAIFTTTWNKIIVEAPIVTRVTNGSEDILQILVARQRNSAKSSSTNVQPKKPNCSPSTLKMKSVCSSGKKARFVCEPLPKPFPTAPPEPIAVMDCNTW